MDVIGAHVGECAPALVLELDASEAPWARREVGVAAPERLELGLLVG
jgi:hypothetical protein